MLRRTCTAALLLGSAHVMPVIRLTLHSGYQQSVGLCFASLMYRRNVAFHCLCDGKQVCTSDSGCAGNSPDEQCAASEAE